ncbi:hypothetical protein [Alkaliphilus sp. B6464]|uniref:hypothetical protein n=1 Tax=Alkaliphilus sp. B6464 TaxID=2731219 RepID=UPI001BAA4869|nr:hypothetical protein [Alkaliphilus sp. B6464]QUH20473.1 hypothetical protein HYG84_11700 [Alkaliphilus sp. B6464]
MLLEDCLKEFIFERQIRKLLPRTIKSYTNNTALFIKCELRASHEFLYKTNP